MIGGDGRFSEEYAQRVLALAIRNDQASELLDALMNGGAFTVDLGSKRLVFITADEVERLAEGV